MKFTTPLSRQPTPSRSQRDRITKRSPLSFTWHLLIILCLLVGIGYRVVNLDTKIYTHDEAFTALRYSGYTETAVVQTLTQQGIASQTQLEQFQQVNPQHNGWDTVNGLLQEEPQLTPLYFLIGHYWTALWGSSIASIRSLSVVFSLLALPCLWWLCQELFADRLTSGIAIALFALSPIQILYAQDARFYSLWNMMTLLSSAALLRAMRVQTRSSWSLYTIMTIASFYTYLLSAIVSMAQLLYVSSRSLSRSQRPTIFALCIATLAIAPWLAVIFSRWDHVQDLMAWTTISYYSIAQYGRELLGQLSLGWFDINRENLSSAIGPRVGQRLAEIFILGVVGYGFWQLCRRSRRQTGLLVVLLALVPASLFILVDLTLGGWRALIPRYMAPAYLGSLIAVAAGLSEWFNAPIPRGWQRSIARIVLTLVLSMSLWSGLGMTQAANWWNKESDSHALAIASIINQSPRPLIISDARLGSILALNHALNPQTAWLVRPSCYSCQLHRALVWQPFLPPFPPGFSHVFVFHPDAPGAWIERAQAHQPYRLRSIATAEEWLWQVEPRSSSSSN